MADPTINGATAVAFHSVSIDITTTSTENILANKAASGQLIRVDNLTVNNANGSAAATITMWRYDQDGTGMHSNSGRYEAAIGADVVAGSPLGEICPTSLSVGAAGGQVVFSRDATIKLHEDESIVVQAGAANDLTINLDYTVLG